jgi:alpha-amylase
MKRIRLLVGLLVLLLAFANTWRALSGQSGFDDDRVMLQGFYWESHRHGHAGYANFGSKHWYEIIRDAATTINQARFDLVWLPPPSYAGDLSAGYNPKEYFTLSNSYGDFSQHRAMLVALLQQGIEPVADIVINHRDGNTSWTDFENPAWGLWAITRDDEAFLNPDSGVAGTPVGQRGAPETHPNYVSHAGTTYQYPSFRDIDHTNMQVRRDLLKYLLQVKSAGYRGWRYDMVHGYDARWIALYNKRTNPTFSVGRVRLGQARRSARLDLPHRYDSRRLAHRERRVRFHHPVHAQRQQGPLPRVVRVRQRPGRDGGQHGWPPLEAAGRDVSRESRHRLPHEPG